MRSLPAVPTSSLHSTTRCVALWAAAVGLVAGSATAGGEPPAAPDTSATQIEAGVEAAHKRFLRHPGGIGIRYRLEFSPNPKQKAYFVFRSGLDGLVNVRWPEFRARVEGPMSGLDAVQNEKTAKKPQPRVRQGSFNFTTFTGVMHDGDSLGQITNYRDPFSSASAYPLRFRYFAETDQGFIPGPEYKSDYWLPHALRSGGYTAPAPK